MWGWENIPLAIEYTALQDKCTVNANRSQRLRSPSFPSPPLCLASGLAAAAASSRIMTLLLSAPPLGGSIVAMVGLPWRRRRGSVEEASCSQREAEQRAPRSQMTPPASPVVLEKWTPVLFSN